MAKEICSNCATKMSEPVSFCPTCDRPTRHAGKAELLEWDLKQWRDHVDRAAATSTLPTASTEGTRSGRSITGVAERMEAPFAAERPERTVAVGSQRRTSRITVAKPRLPRVKREARARRKQDIVIDLDHDNAFAYRACVTCEATDWIVRTTRNDDTTWNYWCVRCSRAFKTEVKLRNAVKPFLSAGIVFGGLAATSILMLH
jgi:hypothetical protein